LLLLQVGLAAAEQKDTIADVLRARRVEIVNTDGARVVLISADEAGNGGLGVYDRVGRPVISVETDAHGYGAVHAIDPRHPQASAAFLGVDAQGSGQIGVRSARMKGGASLGIGLHAAGELLLFNSEGHRAGTLGVDAHGAGLLRLNDRDKRAIVHAGLVGAGRGEISVFDDAGEARTLVAD